MPEPNTDQFRASKELSFGQKNPHEGDAGVPHEPCITTTDDEIYQFRNPNQAAYKHPTEPFELPDGLQTDGTQARHWGEVPVAHEDNMRDLRHNPGGGDIEPEAQVSENERAQLAKFRGEQAAKIADPAKKQAFIAEQGNTEANGKMNRLSHNRLQNEAALEE